MKKNKIVLALLILNLCVPVKLISAQELTPNTDISVKLDQFNESTTLLYEDLSQEQIDSLESGGDTDNSQNNFSNDLNLENTEAPQNSQFHEISATLKIVDLQKYLISQTQKKGTWAAQFILLQADGTKKILSSLNQNLSVKPASTLKLFTGYLAFLNKSYSLESLSIMLHKSDNHMANAALKSVAVKQDKASANDDDDTKIEAGVNIMKNYYSKLENSDQFHPVNGSGLNTTRTDRGDELNKLTARTETHLLEKIIKDGNYNTFKKLLAQPGQFGTLAKRLHGLKMYAKTGTLEHTKSLAGYVETKKGTLIFSIIGDELKIPTAKAMQVIDDMVRKHVASL